MNSIINQVIDIINEYKVQESFNKCRRAVVYICGGDHELCNRILAHSTYIKAKTNTEDIILDTAEFGSTYSIYGKDLSLKIIKGELIAC